MKVDALAIMSYYDFLAACATGDLNQVKQFNPEDVMKFIGKNYDLAIRVAFTNGHSDVAKWLYSTDHLGHCDHEVFVDACEYGNVALVEVIYSMNDFCPTLTNGAFRVACLHGHLSVAKFLDSTGDITYVSYEDDYYDRFTASVFYQVRDRGHTNVIEWLTQKGYKPDERRR